MKRNAVRTLFLLLALTASICLMSVAAFATTPVGVDTEAALRDAVAVENNVVKLTKNIELTRKLTVSSDLTIDLNGYNITQGDSGWDVNDTNYGLIQVQGKVQGTSDVTLTLTGSGSITASRTVGGGAGPLSALCAFGPHAHIRINGGVSATSDNIALYAYRGGTITIEDGASGTFRGLEADYQTGSGTDVEKPDYYLSYTADGKKVLYTPFVIEPNEPAVSEPGESETPEPVAQITIKTVEDNAVLSQNTADVTVTAATDTGSVDSENVVAPTVAMTAKKKAAEEALKTAITANQNNTFTAKAGDAAVTPVQLIQTPAVQNVIKTAMGGVTASGVTTVSVELQTSLTGYEMKEKKDGTVVPTSVTYDVKPVVVLKGEDGAIELPFVPIENEALAADNLSFTFVLPVPEDIAAEGATVYVQHEKDEPVVKTVVNHQVEVTADSFSSFIITPVVPVTATGDFEVTGARLRLTGVIEYQFGFNSGATNIDNYKGGVVKFVIGGNREYEYAIPEDLPKYLSCPVYPNELNHIVTMTVYPKNGVYPDTINGKENYIYSMDSYWNNSTIAKAIEKNQSLGDLKNAMLAYGDYAMYYYEFVTKNNTKAEKPTSSLPNVSTDNLDAYQATTKGNNIGIEYVGGALTLNSQLDVKVYFQLTDNTASFSDYTFTRNGKPLAGVQSGSYYIVTIKNLAPNQYEKQTITISRNEYAGQYEVSYGANTYIRSCLSHYNDGNHEALIDLVKAMYQYGIAADRYSSSQGQAQ